jgi:hypothetical protein
MKILLTPRIRCEKLKTVSGFAAPVLEFTIELLKILGRKAKMEKCDAQCKRKRHCSVARR